MNESHDIIDIGVNLAHRSFRADRKQVIERAFAAGVQRMVITGTSVVGSQEGVRIAREYPGQLFATAGVHPHDSRNCTEATLSELRHLATHKEVVAIGECGLYFNRDFSPRPQQEKWFEARELIKEIPLNRLMIETDAPFLAQRTMPTKPKDGRNEPAYLTYVLVAVADCLGKPFASVAEATTKTAREFFRLND